MSDARITVTSASVPMKRRDTRKKDQAPRGVFRHRSGVWAVRFTCGAGHIHQERVGPLKSDAVRRGTAAVWFPVSLLVRRRRPARRHFPMSPRN